MTTEEKIQAYRDRMAEGEEKKHSQWKHGGIKTRAYLSWAKMRERCLNSSCPAFPNYGGRGIKISKRWDKFENFLKDMGERPSGYSLERVDVNGNYSPENCKWIPRKEQNFNTRKSIRIHFRGETRCLSEWCRILNLRRGFVLKRLRLGWSFEDAIKRPIRIPLDRREVFRRRSRGETYNEIARAMNSNYQAVWKACKTERVALLEKK